MSPGNVTRYQEDGETSGRALAFDLGAYDTSMPTARIGAGGRFREELGYTACPYHWFAGAAGTALAAKLGEVGPSELVPRTAAPRCGRADHDRAGTAQGNWYVKAGPNDFEQEDLDVALAPDVMDPSVPVLSIGSTAIPGLPRGLYTHTPDVQGPRFESVATGKSGCFVLRPHRNQGSDLTGKVVIISVGKDQGTGRETLHIGAREGSDCAGAPALPAGAARFER